MLSIPADTAPGSYRIRVIADANSAVPEADEGNNSVLTGLLNVVRADLTVASVTFAPLATLPGGNVTVTHTVKNLSPVPATAVGSFSHLYLGANQSVASAAVDFGTVFVPAIPGGATSTVVKGVQIPGNTAPGLYYVVVNADDTGVIFEPNEGNNTGASLARLIVGPDVLPTVATTGTGVAPGANASVTYTLKNQGGQAANLDVFFDLIPQPSGSPISIGPSRTISGFAAGATTAFTNVVLVPSGTAPGSTRSGSRRVPSSTPTPATTRS